MGIINILFYDDGIIAAESKKKAEMCAMRVKADLLNAHILPSVEKSEWEPVQKIQYLGHVFDLGEGMVSVSKDRIERFSIRLGEALSLLPNTTARAMARVVGSVISMELVLQLDAQFYSRAMQRVIQYKEKEGLRWTSVISLEEIEELQEVMFELEFWRENIVNMNSRRFNMDRMDLRMAAGDAGDRAEGGYLFDDDGNKMYFHEGYSEEQSQRSSTERELSCLRTFLLTFPAQLHGKKVIYSTDSRCLHIIYGKGSGKKHLHTIALQCRNLARELSLRLETGWIPREWNEEADIISKIQDVHAWGLSKTFFDKIVRLHGDDFTVDAFADSSNFKCSRFFSWTWCVGSSGVDAFKQNWRGENVYAVPPPRMLLQVVNKFREDGCKGVVVFPFESGGFVSACLAMEGLAHGVVNRWRFPGKDKLWAQVDTKFNAGYTLDLVVVKLDFTQF